jgi:chromosome segregation ATPase
MTFDLSKNRQIESNRRQGAARLAAPVLGTTQPAQVAGMAEESPRSPGVRIEVRNGGGQPVAYEVADAGFLIGSVSGCDLRLPGANLAPVIGLITPGAEGTRFRKLAPAQAVLVNGQPVSQAVLGDGDFLTLGKIELRVSLSSAATGPARKIKPAERGPVVPAAGAELTEQVARARHHLQQQVDEFRAQVAAFHKEQKQLEEEDQARRQELSERQAQLDARHKQLDEQAREIESDRGLWVRRREEIDQEGRKLHERERAAAAAAIDLEKRERAYGQNKEELTRFQGLLDKRAREVERQQEELAGIRQELAEVRRQLYDRYRERRDRLAGLQEAVTRAARKVQERKRQLEAETAQAAALREEQEARQAQLDLRTTEQDERQQQLDEQGRQLDARREDLQEALANRHTDLQARETWAAEERQALEKSQTQHQADLLRLDRLQAALDQRQKGLEERAAEIDRRVAELQSDSREIEEQAGQLDQWHTKLTEEAEKLARQKAGQDAAAAQVAQRAAAFEGQQAMLATLRTRLERMREDLRREEQQLTEQRVRQEATEADLRERVQEAQRLRAELDTELQLREQERQQFNQRSALLEAAVAQLRQAQEALAREEEELRERNLALENAAALQAEEAGLVQARAAQLEEFKQRVEADRQALRERTEALAREEQVRAALQEQLRKRSDELGARQKELAERERRIEADLASVATGREEINRTRQAQDAHQAALREEIEARAAELDRLRDDLVQREQTLRRHVERLKEAGRNIGGERKTLGEEKDQWLTEQQKKQAEMAQAQADLTASQREAGDLRQQLPELELRARAAADKLTQAREQLQGHLAEIHAYARQSRESIETMLGQVHGESERVRQQEVGLHRARDEHRLAVAAFRQHLVEWQGQLSEMKQALAHGETRLEQRQARIEEQARQVDATSARLSRQAEELEQQERVVAERRGEMDRHLEDMREWYRRKLRELAGIRDQGSGIRSQGSGIKDQGSGIRDRGSGNEDERETGVEGESTGDQEVGQTQDEEQSIVPEAPASILALTAEVDPGDRKLGELMRSLDLIDADTLTALLVEARRQRRSLRQVLLAGGSVTLYQLALIEAGNVEGLILGPVRVVDRLRVTAQETLYRVFDPRPTAEGGGHFLLRHLAEVEAEDAVRPDEFRQRFAAAAAVQHPHLLATREVLEIAGRPAVLQEWPTGLPSTEWPALAAVGGVWYRLLGQAALGLHTIHQAGLVHGHLHASLVLLTAEGTVKLCGLGEPPWLVQPPVTYAEEGDVAGDLRALGGIAGAWANAGRRKGAKAKPLAEALQAVLGRLTAANPEERNTSAAALLEDLDGAGAGVPANAEAWDRLLRHVRDHAPGDMGLRQSA